MIKGVEVNVFSPYVCFYLFFTLPFFPFFFETDVPDTVKPLYNDIRYNDKTHYNDNLNRTNT